MLSEWIYRHSISCNNEPCKEKSSIIHWSRPAHSYLWEIIVSIPVFVVLCNIPIISGILGQRTGQKRLVFREEVIVITFRRRKCPKYGGWCLPSFCFCQKQWGKKMGKMVSRYSGITGEDMSENESSDSAVLIIVWILHLTHTFRGLK